MSKNLFLSGSEPGIIRKLNTLGYNTVICEANDSLDSAVRSHADCALFTPDGNTYFTGENNYNNIVNILTKGECKEKEKKAIYKVYDIKSPYPGDVKLNAKTFGRKILCNRNHISREIADFAENNGFELMHCNQGYAACSTVKLNDYAAITDDESVYNTLSANGIDTIIVSKGSVKLNGFDYGFIGGCCGTIENNLIIFTGSIDRHCDSEKIKTFLIKHGMNYFCLTDGDLIDIGGIIAL